MENYNKWIKEYNVKHSNNMPFTHSTMIFELTDIFMLYNTRPITNQTHAHTNIHTNIHTHRQTHAHRQTHRHTDTNTPSSTITGTKFSICHSVSPGNFPGFSGNNVE